ncbi:MAG TPA: hypothetical protein VM656_10865, partial [Pyrinomonadaceae bacterium]|nr:hypothetical protein [Pyrinomonadaceae bacterium]
MESITRCARTLLELANAFGVFQIDPVPKDDTFWPVLSLFSIPGGNVLKLPLALRFTIVSALLVAVVLVPVVNPLRTAHAQNQQSA